MHVNKEQAINKIFKKNFTFPDMLIEAIANSIDAGASFINLEIDDSFEQIIIKDNGIGFNDDNMKSFTELYSAHKLEKGGKGVGRLAYLKFYREILFNSTYNVENKYYQRNFTFNYESEDTLINGIDCSEGKTGTIITFRSFLPKNKPKNLTAELIKESIEAKLLPTLLFWKIKNNKELKINIRKAENTVSISTESLPILENLSFTYIYNPIEHGLLDYNGINELKFDIWYTDQFKLIKKVEASYVAAGRTISSIPLYINDYDNENNSFICFYTSESFNDFVDNDRSSLNLPEKNTPEYPSKEKIISLFYQHIYKVLEKKNPRISELKQQYKQDIKNFYPEYLIFLEEITDQDIISQKKSDLIDKCIDTAKKKNKEFVKLKERIKQGNPHYSPQEVENILELGQSALAAYINKREDILDMLKTLCSDSSSNEHVIHNVIFRKMDTMVTSLAKDDPNLLKNNIEMNNLWIIDDKYMSFNYAFSDKSMRTIFEEIRKRKEDIIVNEESDKGEPDIAIFSDFPEDSQELQALIIEIKSFKDSNVQKGRSYKFEGIRQLRDRARIIHENHPEIKRSCYYLITTIDDGIRQDLISDRFRRAYSHGNEFWFSYEEIQFMDSTRGSYQLPMYILNIETLLADASERNKLFLDILTKFPK